MSTDLNKFGSPRQILGENHNTESFRTQFSAKNPMREWMDGSIEMKNIGEHDVENPKKGKLLSQMFSSFHRGNVEKAERKLVYKEAGASSNVADMMEKFDANGDGNFDIKEVVQIANKAEKSAAILDYVMPIIAIFVFLVVFICGCNFGTAFW